jgi:hypothetical protein
MKIRFIKNVDVDYYDYKLDEIYPKYYQRWDEITIDSIKKLANDIFLADVFFSNGDVIIGVPLNSFEKISG